MLSLKFKLVLVAALLPGLQFDCGCAAQSSVDEAQTSVVNAHSNEAIEWLTGRDFSRARNQTIGVSWNEAPLRDSLVNLASRQRVAIFLDRRVDPSQLIDFASTGRSLDQTIMELTDQLGLGAVRIDDRFYYVGPRIQVAELDVRRQRLVKQMARFPPKAKSLWLAKKNRLEIEHLSEPAVLFNDLNATVAPKLFDRNRIAFDLWPEIDLPPLSLLDRMIVLSFGFDTWFNFSKDAMACELVAAENIAPYKTVYRKRLSDSDVEALTNQYPSLKLDLDRQKSTVTGAPIVHYEINRLLAADNSNSNRPSDGVSRVSLTTNAQIGAILKNIAAMKNVQLKYDPELTSILQQRISLEVNKVSFDELIKKTLQSTDLKYQLTETELLITR